MSKQSLYNIEAVVYDTECDIGALRAAALNEGEKVTDDPTESGYDLYKLGDNDEVDKLVEEVIKQFADAHEVQLQLIDPHSRAARILKTNCSKMVEMNYGCDVVALATVAAPTGAGRHKFSLNDVLPDLHGEIVANQVVVYPGWLKHGITRNMGKEDVILIEAYFRAVGPIIPQEEQEALQEANRDTDAPELPEGAQILDLNSAPSDEDKD